MPDDKLWSLEETARFFNVDRRTILRYVDKGYFPVHRIEKKFFFAPSEIKAALNLKVEATTEHSREGN